MKVLHIGEYVNGGVATYLKTLIKDSDKYGVDSYLLMSNNKSDKIWNIAPEKIFFYQYKRSVLNLFSAIKIINIYIKKINPDIIHVHSSWAGLFVRLPYLFKKRKIKIIYSSHGWAFLMDTSMILKKVYAFIECILSLVTDVIINISQYEQDQAIQYGLNENKLIMIYNGVEDVKVQLKMHASEMNSQEINLLFVGRIDYQKGLDLFLATYYQEPFTGIHLYVIGESLLDNVKMNNDEKTTYLGWVENKELDAYYQECDAVIMPSRWEGFGLVAIESMRNSKPVIVSNRGALPELVQNQVNGYVFNLDDKHSLEKILCKLNKAELKKMGETARKIYLGKFIGLFMRKKMYALYNRLKLETY